MVMVFPPAIGPNEADRPVTTGTVARTATVWGGLVTEQSPLGQR